MGMMVVGEVGIFNYLFCFSFIFYLFIYSHITIFSSSCLQGFAIYVFEIAVSNKFLTFQQSMALNKPCVLFDYFDYHGIIPFPPLLLVSIQTYSSLMVCKDIWHFLSAFGLMCVMTLVYLLDTDLARTPRARIPVF